MTSSTSVTTRSDAGIGYVEIDFPPVNAIGLDVRLGLLDAVDWAIGNNLSRVIISGAGRIFAAGADAREFDKPATPPHLPDVLNAIEQSSVPWIAAINGVALGGGAEIAMACRMRIMAPGAKIGLPEVTLGVIPGAGGTQRLPRLVGLAAALDMIRSGKSKTAEQAHEAGLVDKVAPDPVAAAIAVPLADILAAQPTSQLPPPEYDADIITAATQFAQRKQRGQIAPLRAIDVIADGLTLPFDEALALERAAFLELRASDQAKSLRHIFFAQRAAKLPENISAETVPLDHIAVVGGGTMGAGIAYALLNAGIKVTLLETGVDGMARAAGNVESIIAASLKRGLIAEAGADDRRSRLQISADYNDAADAKLAIEAAFESMEVKQDILTKLADALPSDAILATNTSYLDVNELASHIADPDRVIGLHFFAPAHIMKLLEIVRADQTSDRALATGFALAKKLGKVPVVAGVCDGFIGNRILARYREEADILLLHGATPVQIDQAMVEFGYAMGIYEAQDLSGLDIAHANRRRKDAFRDPAKLYVAIADRLVEMGRLGKKTGAGWYDYSSGDQREDAVVTGIVVSEAKAAGVDQVEFTSDDISKLLVNAMIDEARNILDEGIALDAKDIDLVSVFGYGFPRWRGGLMHHATSLSDHSGTN